MIMWEVVYIVVILTWICIIMALRCRQIKAIGGQSGGHSVQVIQIGSNVYDVVTPSGRNQRACSATIAPPPSYDDVMRIPAHFPVLNSSSGVNNENVNNSRTITTISSSVP